MLIPKSLIFIQKKTAQTTVQLMVLLRQKHDEGHLQNKKGNNWVFECITINLES